MVSATTLLVMRLKKMTLLNCTGHGWTQQRQPHGSQAQNAGYSHRASAKLGSPSDVAHFEPGVLGLGADIHQLVVAQPLLLEFLSPSIIQLVIMLLHKHHL